MGQRFMQPLRIAVQWGFICFMLYQGFRFYQFVSHFRSGGATQSRTEVVALDVVEITKRRPIAKAIERALAALGASELATLRSATG